MGWKKYRKKATVCARVLTQDDYEAYGGVISTNEGSKEFAVGDYLAQDALGIWPIQRQKILSNYCCVGRQEQSPWKYYVSLDVREACQMDEPFVIGSLQGEAGDYLVRSGGDSWPVDRAIFEATYEEVFD